MSREEEYLGAILGSLNGEASTAPAPVWREEEFLCAVLRSARGEKPAIPAPAWRTEAYFAAIAQTLQDHQPVPCKDVNLFDYDGTLAASYTAEEFAALDALPKAPAHRGLIALGWNWTLADAKAYVAKYGKLIIGQEYATADGKTHVHIRLLPGRTSPYVGLAVDGTAVVDWGDGSTPDTITGSSLSTLVYTPQHAYPAPGKYEITIAVTGEAAIRGVDEGAAALLTKKASAVNSNVTYTSAIEAVELAENMGIGNRAFQACYGLSTVVLSGACTSIPEKAFAACSRLLFVSIPSGVTSIGVDAFRSDRMLLSVSIPKGVVTIGTDALAYNYGMYDVSVPEGVTAIPNELFYSSAGITSVVIPEGVVGIGSKAFGGGYVMTDLRIPSTVTAIAAQAFSNCCGLAEIHFYSATPPAVANSNAFENLPADCRIYVPAGKLSAYTSAANYPSSGTYTYVEEDA